MKSSWFWKLLAVQLTSRLLAGYLLVSMKSSTILGLILSSCSRTERKRATGRKPLAWESRLMSSRMVCYTNSNVLNDFDYLK